MPTERLSMRRIRDLLRRKLPRGLGDRAIATALSLSKGSVGAYLSRARAAGLSWPRTRHQSRAWGMTPSFAFVGQPQTNGVVERFFRTLKEQIVHGRVFETFENFCEAVRAFVARYNAEWLVEKNGHLSPHALRRHRQLATMPMAAQPNRVSKEPGAVREVQAATGRLLGVHDCSLEVGGAGRSSC